MKQRLSGIRTRLTFSNVIAVIALFIALGGASYAAVNLPKNSVGTKQLKKNAVNSSKVKDRSLLAKDFEQGQLPSGATGATGAMGPTGSAGVAGSAGAPGPAGNRGATGSTGPVGLIGPTGLTGQAGDSGPTGATGEAGPTGPTGADTATFFAAVNANGTYDADSSRGVLSVSSTQSGIYVVTFDRSSLDGCVANATPASGNTIATIGGQFPLSQPYVFVYTQTTLGQQLLQSTNFYLTISCNPATSE